MISFNCGYSNFLSVYQGERIFGILPKSVGSFNIGMYSSDGDTQFEEDCQEKLLNKRRKESNGKEDDLNAIFYK